MTNDQIEKFVTTNYLDKEPVKVTFKTRKPIVGIFIKTLDYSELKSKNFWRIVGESNVASYLKSRDMNLARIYSGTEITRLSAP